MRTVRTTFDETKVPATKNLPCPTCRRKVRRSTTFTGTSNPFTTPPYRSPAQIRAYLKPEVEAWQATPVTCKKCLDAVRLAKLELVEAAAAMWNEAHPVGTKVWVVVDGVRTACPTETAATALMGDEPRTAIRVTTGPSRSWCGQVEDLTVVTS